MRMPFDRNDIGRTAPRMRRATRCDGDSVQTDRANLPLSVHVGPIANEDVSRSLAGLDGGAGSPGSARRDGQRRDRRVAARGAADAKLPERDNRRKSDYLMMASHGAPCTFAQHRGQCGLPASGPASRPRECQTRHGDLSAGNHLRGVVDRILNELQIEVRIPTPRMRQVALAKLLDACVIIVDSSLSPNGVCTVL